VAAGLQTSSQMNFNETPRLVIWESTQAYDLACVHCRASPMPQRHRERTPPESYNLLDPVRSCANPLVVFTGGDPLKRLDLFDLMAYSVKLGLRANVSASATPLLSIDAIDEFQRLGAARTTISLDGPDAASHDVFRGAAGTSSDFVNPKFFESRRPL
jgi:AdoMet-dependent heme synthase